MIYHIFPDQFSCNESSLQRYRVVWRGPGQGPDHQGGGRGDHEEEGEAGEGVHIIF